MCSSFLLIFCLVIYNYWSEVSKLSTIIAELSISLSIYLYIYISSLVAKLCLTLLQPHGLDRLLCPWDFLSKNTGVGCHFLLQGIFPTQGSSPHLLHQQVDSLHWATGEAPLLEQSWLRCTRISKCICRIKGMGNITGSVQPCQVSHPNFSKVIFLHILMC